MPNYMVIPHILTSESNIDVSEEDDLSVGDNKILRLSIEKENHNNFCNRNYRIVTCDELLIGFSPEDLCDYAIMSGDGVEDLIIQGLFNFQTMKYNNNKVITIMLDTLSCFLGFGNITPITQYPLMKGKNR